jgi:hypothetical protein
VALQVPQRLGNGRLVVPDGLPQVIDVCVTPLRQENGMEPAHEERRNRPTDIEDTSGAQTLLVRQPLESGEEGRSGLTSSSRAMASFFSAMAMRRGTSAVTSARSAAAFSKAASATVSRAAARSISR